jgi:methionyl-tRNA synthetase
MPWGVPVPTDDEHVMYVWFDALVNYISTLGWPDESAESDYTKFWPGIQLAGKDNLRQQSAMWQAMLLSAKLPHSTKILINGFISVGGEKMSKSLGNVIAPSDMVARYGSDATRFLLISLGTFGSDPDVTWERLDNLYTAELANGFGNLCSRVAKMCQKVEITLWEDGSAPAAPEYWSEFSSLMDAYDLSGALKVVTLKIAATDAWLSETAPWELTGDEQKEVLFAAANTVRLIAHHLKLFLPTAADQIFQHYSGEKITALTPLFPRLQQEK